MRSSDPGVTSPPVDRPTTPRISETAMRLVRWSSTPTGLVALFAAGFVLRLVLARGGGFPFDMSSFGGWAARLAEKSAWHFYPHPGEKFFVDYPPGYLYILWGLGSAARAAGDTAPPVFWLKLPAILGDLGLAWMVGALAVRLAPAGRRLPVRGMAAAAILFNPAVFFVSSNWGQADSVAALLVISAFFLLGDPDASEGREAAGAAVLAAAVITKPQALFVVPVAALVLAWRHLRPIASPASEHGRRAAAAGGVWRLAFTGGSGALALLVLAAPFRLSPVKLVNFYTGAAKTYPYTSVFAFNLWGSVGFWRPDTGAGAVRIFGVPAVYVGLALFVVGAVVVLVRAWDALQGGEHEGRVLAFGGIAITLVAFATLTRIHERYEFLAVAMLAAFIGSRRMRSAFGVMSALFLINVYFPYVYYLRFVHRRAPDLGGLFDAFYGHDIAGVRLRSLSFATAVVSVSIAWVGWRWLKAANVSPSATLPAGIEHEETSAPGEPPPKWSLRLHPVGRRGALLALAVFVVAFVSRVAGLGHPPGMYFDEVYHARTGAEYLNHKEVYEWTHPPLAKELIGLSIKELSHFRSSPVAPLPAGVEAGLVASGDTGNMWAITTASGADIVRGRLDASCRLQASSKPVHVDVRPAAIAAAGDFVFVAGTGPAGQMLIRLDGSHEAWRAILDGPVLQIAAVGDAAYVLRTDHTLEAVSAVGLPKAVATKAAAITPAARDGVIWASFPVQSEVASWNASGTRTAVVRVNGLPGAITAPESTKRLAVVDQTSRHVEIVDTESSSVAASLTVPSSGGQGLVATVPETQLAWSAGERSVAIIEPRGASLLGTARLPAPAQSVLADPVRHRLVVATSGGLVCVSGHPTFAWRFGSAVMGGLMAAFVALIALRLFGSMGAAALSALFITVDGLAFTISRIAMNDSYVTAFMLAAWFCALSALFKWGRSPDEWAARSRPAAMLWLAGAGVFGGLALASKWVGLYSLAAIVLFFLWDALRRGADGIAGVAGSIPSSFVFLVVALGAIPLGLYLLSYIPYFALGHSAGDFLKLQKSMYDYHANLRATHPFGSRWYGWPFGHKAVFLYLADHGTHRSEIWTIPNIVVFWGGLFAMVAAAARARRSRSVALVVLVGAALAQFLPWTIVTRVTFLYHYLTVVPFLAIALAWWLVCGLKGYRYQRVVATAVTLAAVAFFFAVLPTLEGWSVSAPVLTAIRHSLPWVLPP